MDHEVDESLIEATIRRVAEAKAAQARVNDEPVDSRGARGTEPGRDVGEDAIEATIRRVAEASAANALPAASELPRNEDEDAIEATIRRVAEASAAQASAGASEPPLDGGEDPSEATIRRVAETSATQFAGVAFPSRSDDEDPIEATIRRVAAEQAVRDAELAARQPDPVNAAIAHAETVLTQDDISMPASHNSPLYLVGESADVTDARQSDSDWTDRAGDSRGDTVTPAGPEEVGQYRRPRLVEREPVAVSGADLDDGGAVARIEGELRETNRRLDQMAARVDALMTTLERVVGEREAPLVGTSRAHPAVMSQSGSDDDDWDDAPRLPRIPLGGPPRPAIVRDPSPMTATAEQLIEDPEVSPVREMPRSAPSFEPARLDERPAAELHPVEPDSRFAPPTAPPPKRGFDLLPKTYRITVEDKRRGVDLVPLHRALLGMDGVKDISLLSYNNGVAIVSVETENGIEPDALNHAVARAMSREVKVEVHNDTTMVVKLAED